MALKLDLVGKPLPPHTFSYDERDVMLYALSVGGVPAEDLAFLYETRGPKVLPTFAVVPAFQPMIDAAVRLNANLLTLLHGEQTIVLHAPIPPKATVTTEATVENVYDKVKGAVLVVKSRTSDARGTLLFENLSTLFCRGEGNFGGDPGPKAVAFDPPEGVAASFRDELTTLPQQAALYRLSGDRNPLHIDPDFAKMAGFDRPILHGLATFGVLGRAVVKHACGGDPRRLRSLTVRFKDVVFPGDVLVSEGFDVGDGVFHLRVATGRGTTVITNARAEVRAGA